MCFSAGRASAIAFDDAVVIEFIADHRRLVGYEGRNEAHHRGIGRRVQHGGRTTVEGCETPLQGDVRRPGSADEADRAGASAIGGGCPLLGLDDFGAQRHAEIAVGIHAQEWGVSLTLNEIARAVDVTPRHDAADHTFNALETSALRHFVKPSGFKHASIRGSAWLSRFLCADLSRIDPCAQRLAHVCHHRREIVPR